MTIAAAATLQIKGLGRQKMDALARRAKGFGMTPERYLKHLVEEDLAISHAAKTTTFARLFGPGQEVDEEEIDRLVERAKIQHHGRVTRKKR